MPEKQLEQQEAQSRILLENRKELSLTGVLQIGEYDGEKISLDTVLGSMEIRGSRLKIDSFATQSGQATVLGKIDAVFYTAEKNAKNGLFGKLFR